MTTSISADSGGGNISIDDIVLWHQVSVDLTARDGRGSIGVVWEDGEHSANSVLSVDSSGSGLFFGTGDAEFDTTWLYLSVDSSGGALEFGYPAPGWRSKYGLEGIVLTLDGDTAMMGPGQVTFGGASGSFSAGLNGIQFTASKSGSFSVDANGKVEMSGFKMSTGASSGYVLTSDA